MYIMCVCLFTALSRRVGALQISIIIIKIIKQDEPKHTMIDDMMHKHKDTDTKAVTSFELEFTQSMDTHTFSH